MMEDQEMRNKLLKSKVKDEQEAASQSKASINSFVYQTQMTAGTASLSASWRLILRIGLRKSQEDFNFKKQLKN